MNLLQLQILILLDAKGSNPTTIGFLSKHAISANNKAYLRLNVCRLAGNHNIRRVNPEGDRKRQRLDGKFLPQHYQITRRGQKYLDYWLTELIKAELKKGYEYDLKEMKAAIMEERIDL